jgi:predicted tellurium resistance membrane protein TerC
LDYSQRGVAPSARPVITASNGPGPAAASRGQDLCSANPSGGSIIKAILGAILLIAFTDLTLQLDNALAISSVASQLPPSQRLPVLAGGVALAAASLLLFTLVGSSMVERIQWLKPIAGLVLVGIGIQMIWGFASR